jgi:hypothetical protein
MREREETNDLGCDLLRKDRQWFFGILGKMKRVLGEADNVARTQKTYKKEKSDSYFFKSNQKEEANLFAAIASASSRFSNLPLTEPEEAVIIFRIYC